MFNTKKPTATDPLALTYSDKDVKRVIDTGSSSIPRILSYIHDQKSNSCTYKEFKDLLASHSVKDKEFTALLEYVIDKKLIHMQVTDKGTILTLTDNAKKVLEKIRNGIVIK